MVRLPEPLPLSEFLLPRGTAVREPNLDGRWQEARNGHQSLQAFYRAMLQSFAGRWAVWHRYSQRHLHRSGSKTTARTALQQSSSNRLVLLREQQANL